MTMLYKKKYMHILQERTRGVMQLLVFKHRDIHESWYSSARERLMKVKR